MSKIFKAIKMLFSEPLLFLDNMLELYGSWIPDEIYLRLRYRCKLGRWPNLKSPKTFTEKINWLKLYDRRTEYSTMVDKYAVKEYVASRIGEQYIIPTIGVWDEPEDIDWDSLPDQFVLKTTHGGGGGGVVICKDKASFDRDKAISTLKNSMKSDIYRNYREWPYKNVPKRIIAEKFMAPKKSFVSPEILDYKFFCFNGEPKFLYVSDSNSHCMSFLNTDWKLSNIGRDDYHPLDKLPERPDNLEEMLEIARKLSVGIPHVRVDLYNIDEHVFFGELTFYTGGGFIPFNPKENDGKLGNLLTLPNTTGGG